jgi:anaerobic selenocysteine-containing dehydrogenase
METVRTICGMCGNDYCGLEVTVEDGKLVAVRGTADNPLSHGKLCPQGRASLELEQHPDRLRYPLRRAGSGWERISWDQALDTIAAGLGRIKEQYGAQSLVVYEGESMLQLMRDGWSRRFMNLYGTPNWAQHDHMCYLPSVIAQRLTYGAEEIDGFEPDYARCIFLWGANPVTSHLTTHWRSIVQARRNGAKLIVIDPRYTQAAAQADVYVPIRPGTDIAFALGLINFIISEELYYADFVDRWTTGFESLAERVKPFTPDRVARLTGVDADLIPQVAETYASNRPGWLDAGNALEHHSNSSQTLRALAILRALTGNLDVPGGHVFAAPLPLADVKLTEKRPVGLQTLGAHEYPLFTEFAGFVPGDVLIETLMSERPYPLKAMLLAGGNPAVTWPNSRRVGEAFQRLDLMVVMELFMTPTAEIADIVLPAASPLEKTQLIANTAPFGPDRPAWFLGLRKQAVDPGERRSDWWFWDQLGRRMGYGAFYPWEGIEEAIDYQLAPLGLSYADLAAHPSGMLYGDPPAYRRYEQEGFRTPSGKVELYSHVLASYGHDPLPRFEEPRESASRAPKTAEKYPLILNAGRRVAVYTHSRHRNLASLRRKAPEPLAEINPATAQAYGVRDGDWIVVESPRGSIDIKARVTEEIVPGTVGLVHGWEEANPNCLTDHQDCDPVFATPSLRAELCSLRKKEPSP